MIEEPDGLLVLAYSDAFYADQKLKSWKKLGTLAIGYRGGRPDAMGPYPSVTAVHLPRQGTAAYVFATIGDGYVTLDRGETSSKAIPGQLSTSGAVRLQNTSEGTLVFERDYGLPYWRIGSSGWEVASLAPPLESASPDDDLAAFEKNSLMWDETKVLVDPAGKIFTVSSTNLSPGTRTTARREGGRSERIGREVSSLSPEYSFLTADGTLWNAYFGELKRFENGQWKVVAQLPNNNGPGELRPLNASGPPWVLLDEDHHLLWKLDHGKDGQKVTLSRVALSDAKKAIEIRDAISWSPNSLLLATSDGLQRYDLTSAKTSPAALPEPPQPATCLVQDGRGRLWLGGKGLWLLDKGATSLESFHRFSWIARSEVSDLEANPREIGGVIAALGPNGVAYVQAGQAP